MKSTAEKVICADCGADMVLRQTQKFKWNNGKGRLFYGCTNYPKCKATHGAHPDGKPLGTPADAETKKARIEAHAAMDKVVQERGWGRDAKDKRARHGLYVWLGRKLGMPDSEIKDKCHVGMFDRETCMRVIEICNRALEVKEVA